MKSAASSANYKRLDPILGTIPDQPKASWSCPSTTWKPLESLSLTLTSKSPREANIWASSSARMMLCALGSRRRPRAGRKRWRILPKLPPTSHKLPIQACRNLSSKNGSLSRDELQKGLVLSFEMLNSLYPRSFCRPYLEMILTSPTLVANPPVSR